MQGRGGAREAYLRGHREHQGEAHVLGVLVLGRGRVQGDADLPGLPPAEGAGRGEEGGAGPGRGWGARDVPAQAPRHLQLLQVDGLQHLHLWRQRPAGTEQAGSDGSAGWGCGTAGVRGPGRCGHVGGRRDWGRFGGCYQSVASASPAAAAISPPTRKRKRRAGCQETPRRRARAAAERGEVHLAAGSLPPRLGARPALEPVGRSNAWGAGGRHSPGGTGAGRSPAGGDTLPLTGLCASQLSGPVPSDGELPHPGDDRRRVLRARVQGAPEAQRPGEGTGLGLCSVWPGLISGASRLLRLCQDFGTRHSFGFLLTFLTSSSWH